MHPKPQLLCIVRNLLLVAGAMTLPGLASGAGASNAPSDKGFERLMHEIEDLKAKVAAQEQKIQKLEKEKTSTSGNSASAIKEPASKTSAPAAAPQTGSTDDKAAVGGGGSAKLSTSAPLNRGFDALEVPDSPSAAILGVAPQKVARPSTPKEVIAAVISAVDERGNFQAGAAIDVAPYQIFSFGQQGKTQGDRNDPPEAPKITDRQRPTDAAAQQDHERLDPGKYLIRVAERTQLSLATTKGTEDADKSMRLAFGIQTTLMNETDPLYKRYRMDQEKALKSLGIHFEDAQHRNSWHYNSSWSVGVAQVLIARDGTSGNFRPGATGVFSTYSYGFEGLDKPVPNVIARTVQSHAQLLLDVRYLNHDIVPDPAMMGAFMPEDSLRGALRLRMGYPDVNFSINETVTREWLKNRENTAYETAFALELRLPNSGTWITASLGKEFDRADGKSPLIALAGVKIGYTDKP
jgi:hypothetical protein